MWFYLLYSIVAPIGVLLVPKGILVNRLEYGVNDLKVNLPTAILNYVPWYNSWKMARLVLGSAKFYFVLLIYALLTTAMLLPVRFIFWQSESLQFLMTMWMIPFLIISYLAEVVLLFKASLLLDRKRWAFLALFPPLGAAVLYPHVLPYFRNHFARLRGTFDGNGAKG